MGKLTGEKIFQGLENDVIDLESTGACARLVPDRAHNRAQNICLYYQYIIKFCARVPAVPGLNPVNLFFIILSEPAPAFGV